jgi:hypothetical protein
MADLNKEEFAAMCHTTVAIINTNINREKIVYDKKAKLIDSDDPLNKAFFRKYMSMSEQKKIRVPKDEDIAKLYDKVVQKATADVETQQKETKRAKQHDKSQKNVDMAERKLAADTLLQEAKAEKEQMNLQKLAGKLIPVDLVFAILNIHNHDIFATFQNDVENLASVYCDILAGGDRKRLAEITGKLSEKLNDSVTRAKDVALSSLENAIEDYRETRSRGESK